MPRKSLTVPVPPGSPCWVLPAWERGMVVAFDPADTPEAPGPVLVAWCSYTENKVGGVFPDKSDLTRAPSTYQRQHRKKGVEFKDTASCPSYFAVEWLPADQVSYSPPPEKQRPSSLDHVYEPVDAVLRNVPLLTQELWNTKARLYGEHGDGKALLSLPAAVRSALGLSAKWRHRVSTSGASRTLSGHWECDVLLPTTDPSFTDKGMLLVERDMPHPGASLGWKWKVLNCKGVVRATASVKYAIEGMAAAEAKYPVLPPMKDFTGKSGDGLATLLYASEDDDLPF